MENVKIKTKNHNLYGKEVMLPIDGKVKVSENGELEVSGKCAELILLNSNSYELVEDEQELTQDDLSGTGGVKGDKGKSTNQTLKTQETDDEELEDDDEDDEDIDESDEDLEEDEEEETEESEDDDEEEYTKDDLKSMEKEDLQEILKNSDLPKSKYKSILNNKSKMIDFILENV